MAGKYVPPGFDKAGVLAGLHKAMQFGAPTRTDDRATFFFRTPSETADPVDESGVPFDPDDQQTNVASPVSLQVDCAVEYFDAAGVQTSAGGEIRPAKIEITLLDAEYQKVKTFEYVAAGGDKYFRKLVEPPVALGSIDVWTVHATAESES